MFVGLLEDKTRPGLCLKAAAHLFSEAGLQGAVLEVKASFLQHLDSKIHCLCSVEALLEQHHGPFGILAEL